MGQSIINIGPPNVDILKAKNSQLTFSTKYPFTKIDALNPQSFQSISFVFNNEPPGPDNVLNTPVTTLLYQFKHGYKYIPSLWFQWQNSAPQNLNPLPANGSTETTYYPFGDDTSYSDPLACYYASVTYNYNGAYYIMSYAYLTVVADNTNAYIYITKIFDNSTVSGSTTTYYPVNVIDTRFKMRIYVFCEPALGNSQ